MQGGGRSKNPWQRLRNTGFYYGLVIRAGVMSKGHGLALGDFLGAGEFPAVIAAAPVFPASPFRDMQGVRVVPTISSGASSTVVQDNQLL